MLEGQSLRLARDFPVDSPTWARHRGRQSYLESRNAVREWLGPERFAAAWERGKKLDPIEAAQEVMEALNESG